MSYNFNYNKSQYSIFSSYDINSFHIICTWLSYYNLRKDGRSHLRVCSISTPRKMGPGHKNLASYNKMVISFWNYHIIRWKSICMRESQVSWRSISRSWWTIRTSGWEPHWQGTSFYNSILNPGQVIPTISSFFVPKNVHDYCHWFCKTDWCPYKPGISWSNQLGILAYLAHDIVIPYKVLHKT